MKKVMISAATVLLASLITSCSGGSDASDKCEGFLEARFGEDGLVDVDDMTETESGVMVKVEGAVTYREERGAGDRVETTFTCQLEQDESGGLTLSELTVK